MGGELSTPTARTLRSYWLDDEPEAPAQETPAPPKAEEKKAPEPVPEPLPVWPPPREPEELSTMPKGVILKILGMLEPEDLCSMAGTAAKFRALAYDDSLWEHRAFQINESLAAESRKRVQLGLCGWRDIYAQGYLGAEEEELYKTTPLEPQYEPDFTRHFRRAAAYFKGAEDRKAWHEHLRRFSKYEAQVGAFAEAAECLLEVSADYEWGDTAKDEMYKSAIVYFERAHHWERAQELTQQYRQRLLSQPRQGDAYKATLGFVDGLEESLQRSIRECQDRLFEQYFFVEFLGDDFKGFKDKRFIVRGSPCQHIVEFTQILRTRWPDANIVHSHVVKSPNGKGCIRVHLCKPVKLSNKFAEIHGLPQERRANIPRKIPLTSRKYYESINNKIFLYSRPYTKGNSMSESDSAQFTDLWISHYYLVSEATLPSTHRWTEVIKTVEVEKSPIENACDAVEAKNREVVSVLERIRKDGREGPCVNSLSMLLSGIVDAAVCGGIKHYLDTFLSPQYIRADPKNAPHVERLRAAIIRQVEVASNALSVHKQVIVKSLLPLHSGLEASFAPWKERATQVCETILPEISAAMQQIGDVPELVPEDPVTERWQRASGIESIIDQLEEDGTVERVIMHPRQQSSFLAFTPLVLKPSHKHRRKQSFRRQLSMYLVSGAAEALQARLQEMAENEKSSDEQVQKKKQAKQDGSGVPTTPKESSVAAPSSETQLTPRRFSLNNPPAGPEPVEDRTRLSMPTNRYLSESAISQPDSYIMRLDMELRNITRSAHDPNVFEGEDFFDDQY